MEIVKYLVKQGADIYANNNEAFKSASAIGYIEIIQYLLFDFNMKINKRTKDWLIRYNKKEVLELIEKRDLLLKLNQDIIQKDFVDNLGKKVKI